MSFDTEWLALREPADRSARDPLLLAGFREAVGTAPITDLGCGTGSTLRATAVNVSWTLVDLDERLLAEAKARHPEIEVLRRDLSDVASLPLAGRFVTASALFDLCSADFVERMVAAMGEARGLYAALNYDGRILWDAAHPMDAEIVAAFNAHQRSDKGFGPALGPDATDWLAACFEPAGFGVTMAQSPWKLGQAEGALQLAFLEGVADAAAEMGVKTEDWLLFRQRVVAQGGSCEVGHLDLLALRGAG